MGMFVAGLTSKALITRASLGMVIFLLFSLVGIAASGRVEFALAGG
jgi:hypothetical protein